MIEGKSVINGKKTHAVNTTSFFTYDANKSSQLPQKYDNATLEEIEYSCEIASQVFLDYAATTSTIRAAFLMEIKAELENTKTPIIEQYKLESG